MRLAFYKAKYGRWYEKGLAYIEQAPFSHVELVFNNGEWFSASPRDNGTRFKLIKPATEHWVYLDIECNECRLYSWCSDRVGLGYNWWGLINCFLPISIPNHCNKWFCSQICLAALQLENILPNLNPDKCTPNMLYKHYLKEI